MPSPAAASDAAPAIGQPIRVGLVGYGLAGSVFHAPLIARTPGLELAAIATSQEGRRAEALRLHPRTRLFPDAAALVESGGLDLIVVATPNRSHVEIASAALDVGVAVVVDKPLAPTAAEALALVGKARRQGSLLVPFHNRRWDSDFLTARMLVASGRLGPVVRMESRFERFRPAPKVGAWRERPDEGGGLLLDLGTHLVDQALQLFGPITTVYAELARRRVGVQVDDDVFLALGSANGASAHLYASVIPARPGPRLRLVGMSGVYEKFAIDGQEEALRGGCWPGDPAWGREPDVEAGTLTTGEATSVVRSVPGAYERFYAELRDALRKGTPAPVDPLDAVAGLRIIEAAGQSAATGTVVRIDKRIAKND